jgi:hypothetical protein
VHPGVPLHVILEDVPFPCAQAHRLQGETEPGFVFAIGQRGDWFPPGCEVDRFHHQFRVRDFVFCIIQANRSNKWKAADSPAFERC